jgi:hypothetical protein
MGRVFWFWLSSLLIGRHGITVTIYESVEPVKLPVQTFNQMLRLAGPRQIVILTREHHDFRGHAEMFERPIPLLALLDGHAKVVV